MLSDNPYTEWTETPAPASITVEKLDSLVSDYVEKRKEYEAAKRVASDKYALVSDAENAVTEALKALGKKSYKLEGVGTFTRVMKEVITVPKDVEQKRELYSWIEARYGKDVLDEMTSINHQRLNSFYNQEVEKEKDNPAFTIPGLDAPTSVENVSFRKA